MAPTSHRCSATACTYETPEDALTIADKLAAMTLHTQQAHPQPAVQAHPQTQGAQSERVKRPVLHLSGQAVEQEEYDHFVYLFDQYKSRLSNPGEGGTLLRECLGEDVSRILYCTFGTSLSTQTEEQLKTNITKHCVNLQTIQARATELHRLKQEPGQNFQTFLASLKAKARQCEMKLNCSSCNTPNDYSDKVILTLLVKGISDTELQQDLLTEADLTIERCTKMAVARETAKRSQETFTTGAGAAGISAYKQQQKLVKIPPGHCHGCGQKKHKVKEDCPAWEKSCPCGKKGHLVSVCYRKGKPPAKNPNQADKTEEVTNAIADSEEATLFSLSSASPPEQPAEVHLASLIFDKKSGSWTEQYYEERSCQLRLLMKVNADQWTKLQPDKAVIQSGVLRRSKQTMATGIADTGASVLCSGLSTLRALDMTESQLCPTSTVIRVANAEKLTVLGMLPVVVTVVGHPEVKTLQALYITKELKKLYVSKPCLVELGCLPTSWPYPPQPATCSSIQTPSMPSQEDNSLAPCGCAFRQTPPPPPDKLPFPATENNRGRLEEWLLNYYSSSTFNTCSHQSLPVMAGRPLRLAVKEDATPVAHHRPYRVAIHWEEEIKAGLERDVKLGIIERVPDNDPSIWCHQMVVATKPGSNKPRRTVDMSALKAASYRQTHPGSPPFLESQSVPVNTFKTVTDAWQGFHMIPLDPDSRQYTTFITPWGKFRYVRMPMGDHVSMDAYNYRFDKVTEKVVNLKRCVDDSLLHSDTLEAAFHQTTQYLSLLGNHGILQNPDKFKFGHQEIEWAGFLIGKDTVSPLPKHTESIRTFPTPHNITDLRSFMALLQQVSYCYAISPAIQPLRHLLKPTEKWNWTEEVNNVFEKAKETIAEKVNDGIKLFNPKLPTGVMSDWCQDGMGFILCQKHCSCPPPIDFNCCKTGWVVCSVGSKFCQSAEARYSPTEGELLAVAEALEKTRYFTLGSPDLTLGVDHKPLLGILNDDDISKIKNPRIRRLKERILQWAFNVKYVPGKMLGGTDALSRYGVKPAADDTVCQLFDDKESRVHLILQLAEQDEDQHSDWPDDSLQAVGSSMCPPISWTELLTEQDKDLDSTKLMVYVLRGFPESKLDMPPGLQQYWRIRDLLTVHHGVIHLGERPVAPPSLRHRVLDTLHSAHQGTTSMRLRAERSLYWPNMALDIAKKRDSCPSCCSSAPSQSPEPPITPIVPQYPFQHIASDYYHHAGHNFGLIVDRFSNWIQVYQGKGGSNMLVNTLSQAFSSFGIPETLTSDGGPQYISGDTENFLARLGVHHRLSSVGFPHSNQKAEKAVGAAKKVIRDAVKPSGDLDPVALTKGLLQLRNTPDPDTGLSPAEMLLGRQLRDFLPIKPSPPLASHKDLSELWRKVADWRELALAPRAAKAHERLQAGTKELQPLDEGDCVLIQNQEGNHPKRWDKRGRVIEVLPNRQYKVMVFGSRRLTLRNRRFLRKFKPVFPAGTDPRTSPPTQPQAQQLPPGIPQPPGTSSNGRAGAGHTATPTCQGQQPSYSPPQPQYQEQPLTTHLYQPAQGQDHLQSPAKSAPLPDIPVNTQVTTFQQSADDNLTATPTSVSDMAVYTPHPGNTAVQPHLPESVTPRRSSRCNKGLTDRYKDFVQSLGSHYQHQYPLTNHHTPMPPQAIPYHHQPYFPQPSHLLAYQHQDTPTPAYLYLSYYPFTPVEQYHIPTPRQSPPHTSEATCQQIGVIMVPQLHSDFRNSPEPYQSQQGGWA